MNKIPNYFSTQTQRDVSLYESFPDEKIIFSRILAFPLVFFGLKGYLFSSITMTPSGKAVMYLVVCAKYKDLSHFSLDCYSPSIVQTW